MTRVWSQTVAGQPHTHVLIVGVGAYLHLRGGADPKSDIPDMDLKQLTSPPISARKFADWVCKEFNNPEAPLGTVELLLSDPLSSSYQLPDGRWIDIERGTIANIKGAFDRWYIECDRHEGNIAIFYFCGHGVMVQGDHILLAEDYGASSRRPYESALHFEPTYLGMARCKATCQCYFIDACSNVTVDGLEITRVAAQIFVQPQLDPPEPPALVLIASAPGESARAEPGQVSLFTDVLLRCFNGLASEYDQQQWVVWSTLLVHKFCQVLKSLSQSQGKEMQRPNDRGTMEPRRLHVHQNPPRIPLTIRFDPHQAIKEAELVLQSSSNPTWQEQGIAVEDYWSLEQVEVGLYMLHARFRSGKYQELDKPLWVSPPGPRPVPDPIICKEHQ